MISPRSEKAPPSRRRWLPVLVLALAGTASAALVPLTSEDFRLSGTQPGDVSPDEITTSSTCSGCHGPYDPENDPGSTWSGSLMAMAGRDPLFWAQMTLANQDVPDAGTYCMRCHVPMTFVTGTAVDPSGASLNEIDEDGVNCSFCHSMVDPIYKPGVSPVEDEPILAALEAVPQHYGNAMYVLDPTGTQRGPYEDAYPPHGKIVSPFHRTGDMCGTCHDVGNVAVSRQPDGTYRYNNVNEPVPDEDPHSQFPLERTFTEWKLSAFANGGVDMGGRFGGDNGSVVSTCQDCHMPRTTGKGCGYGPTRTDLARHDFAGASAWVLDIIALYYGGEPGVDVEALQAGQDKAIDMIERSASLEVAQDGDRLRVRLVNESGHKLPTGHIEGRRVFLNVSFYNKAGRLVTEYGHYDWETAELDEASTQVYEMKVGLSEEAAAITGLPEGETTHMALADTIVKDNRIPPRGFSNEKYAAAGAPAVAATYADGQHWADSEFTIPVRASKVVVTAYYQTVTRHYIEALKEGNHSDEWGDTLYQLWLLTERGAPIPIASKQVELSRPRRMP